jgi:hypothetical protein
MIDGATAATRYFTFPAADFSVQDRPYEVRIAENRFSLTGLHLRLADAEGSIDADLDYGPTVPPRRSLWRPGVMGSYSFVPYMECYHGIASLDHRVDGRVNLRPAGQPESGLVFSDGRGYIEKDWGTSMPQSWVWVQSNNFEAVQGPASLFFSLARVPWRGKAFNGFISILYVGGHEYRFATYTGARLDLLEQEGATLRILLSDRVFKMEILIRRSREGSLAAPVDGAMDRRIAESADSRVRVVLKRRHGNADLPLFDAASPASGVEIVGDTASLFRGN